MYCALFFTGYKVRPMEGKHMLWVAWGLLVLAFAGGVGAYVLYLVPGPRDNVE